MALSHYGRHWDIELLRGLPPEREPPQPQPEPEPEPKPDDPQLEQLAELQQVELLVDSVELLVANRCELDLDDDNDLRGGSKRSWFGWVNDRDPNLECMPLCIVHSLIANKVRPGRNAASCSELSARRFINR